MRMYDVILKKRGGVPLTDQEIQFFVNGFVAGEIPDYQISALMMAIYFQGFNDRETLDLVRAMIDSGDKIDLSGIKGHVVDKHSTGGVGDKTSLVLGPLVASCGIPVAKLSGRGLGHTGGTLDKLESISGFRFEMSSDEFVENVNKVGIALGGQTANLVPADKQLYSLRDVTATVENLSLIAGSIMSKKIVCGADSIVLDVKCGSGAFMKKLPEAISLAEKMVMIGEEFGIPTLALISDMDQPLGNVIGNSLEIIESIETLQGGGPEDFRELCIRLGIEMLMQADRSSDESDARSLLEAQLDNGKALQKFKDWIENQGGDIKQIEDISLLPKGNLKYALKAERSGIVSGINAESIGRAAMVLGAGRETKESRIDYGAGIILKKKKGSSVEEGDVIAELITNDESKIKQAAEMIREAYTFSEATASQSPIILARVTKEGIQKIV